MLKVLILVGIGLTLSLAEYVPGQVIVKYKAPSVAVASSFASSPTMKNRHPNAPFFIHSESPIIDQKRASLMIQSSRKLRHPFEGVQRIEFDPSTNIDEAIKWIRSQSDIEYAYPNVVMRVLDTVPNDEFYSLRQRTNDATMFFEKAWDISTGSASILVAVIDSGVDYNHPDLLGNVLKGHDYVNNDDDPMDDYGHGTHVAGIIGAIGNNGIGVAGVNWNSKILALKVVDNSGEGNSVSASLAIIDAVDAGADIINISFGGAYTSGYDIAIDYAYVNNVVVVAAMGNYGVTGNNVEGIDISLVKYSPVCNDGEQNMVIGVASVGLSKTRSKFSNYSATYCDVSAIGESVYSSISGGGYAVKQGTSMATPMVSGLASLILSVNPKLTNVDVAHIIMDRVTPLFDKTLGAGLMNAYSSLSSIASPDLTTRVQKFYCAPNPVHNNGTIFYLDSYPLRATIKIYSLSGHLVYTNSISGRSLIWNRKDMQENTCPAGIYLAIAEITNQNNSKDRRITKVLVK